MEIHEALNVELNQDIYAQLRSVCGIPHRYLRCAEFRKGFNAGGVPPRSECRVAQKAVFRVLTRAVCGSHEKGLMWDCDFAVVPLIDVCRVPNKICMRNSTKGLRMLSPGQENLTAIRRGSGGFP